MNAHGVSEELGKVVSQPILYLLICENYLQKPRYVESHLAAFKTINLIKLVIVHLKRSYHFQL